MIRTRFLMTGVLAAVCLMSPAQARPILYAHSFTFLADYRADAMKEAQVSYAPTAFLSFGLGHLELDGAGPGHEHHVDYLRLNALAKRWNFEAAQANIFVWAGAGRSKLTLAPDAPDAGEHNHGPVAEGQSLVLNETAGNVGGQIDYETRRIYASLATDSQFATSFTHRMDTAQFGLAPYEHEADGLSTWFVVSVTRFSGNVQQDTQVSLLLRLFKKFAWVEVGATTDGKPQARVMLSF
jgi:hypothetical protein